MNVYRENNFLSLSVDEIDILNIVNFDNKCKNSKFYYISENWNT